MTELERRAMLGDRQAQEEVCVCGKLLPCPKCFKDSAKFIGDAEDFGQPITIDELQTTKNTAIAVACTACGIVSSTYELGEDKKGTLIKLVVDWNARPAPPFGRCKDCTHKEKATVNAKGFLICPASGMEIAEDDFCSYFEPKTE